MQQRPNGIVALCQLGVFFPFDKGFAELAVVAVFGKDCGLIVSQMAQAVSGKLVAPQRLNQPGYLPGSPGHEGAFQRGQVQPVQHSGGNADDVFSGGADFTADQVLPVIKADQIAGKFLHQPFLELLVVAVDDHTVGNPLIEFLYMAGSQPHGYFVGKVRVVVDHLRQAAAGSNFDSLHAQHKDFIGQVQRLQFIHQRL